MRRRILFACRLDFNSDNGSVIKTREGLMPHIPVRHP